MYSLHRNQNLLLVKAPTIQPPVEEKITRIEAWKQLLETDSLLLANIFSFFSTIEIFRTLVPCCRHFKDTIYNNLEATVKKITLKTFGKHYNSLNPRLLLTHPAFQKSVPRRIVFQKADAELHRFFITNPQVKYIHICEDGNSLIPLLEERAKKVAESGGSGGEIEGLKVHGIETEKIDYSHPLLAKLSKLSLVSNIFLTKIGSELPVQNMKKLKLSSLGLRQLPECVKEMRQLESLNLHYNTLSTLPRLEFPNLTSLDVSSNRQLTAIPDLTGLPKLKYLNLSFTAIESSESVPPELLEFIWKPLAKTYERAYEFSLDAMQLRYMIPLADGKCHIGIGYHTVHKTKTYNAGYVTGTFIGNVNSTKKTTEAYIQADFASQATSTNVAAFLPSWLNKILFSSSTGNSAKLTNFKVMSTIEPSSELPLQPLAGYHIQNHALYKPPKSELGGFDDFDE